VDSESDESEDQSIVSDEPTKKIPVTVETIGPPKILKYHPENKERIDTTSIVSNDIILPSINNSENIEDVGSFMKDFNVYINGGSKCEFCGQLTKPWPSIQNQEAFDLIEVIDFKILIEAFTNCIITMRFYFY
jgi:hypothetical protein